MELYPAIDLKDGQCVRLVEGRFNTVHKVADDPVQIAGQYRDAGASVIHLVDLDGALNGKRKNAEKVKLIVDAAAPAKVELGGGLRCMEDLHEVAELGVWRFIVGSAAVDDFSFVQNAVEKYGHRVAVGIDARDGFVKTHGWTANSGINEIEFAKKIASGGVETIIYTDISKDGTLQGPSLDRLKSIKSALPGQVTLVASGGVSCLNDIRGLRHAGVQAAIAGKALYAGTLDLTEGLAQARHGELFDKQDLVPAIVQHAETSQVLMLGYMNCFSLYRTLQTRRVTFWSRSRKTLWTKGETSGNFLISREILTDCDKDTLLVRAIPSGPICHTGNESCFFCKV
ncbi:MAG: 1-(5-phosphoribosyl)-5-[(5-phosphoribosylamino)methylideneamino]imidazole-4-carboxamide isomerase [Oscillospiraceae bacterium]|nr:1-(5-phosphoribosyl)-5-[(5-phosphoribosylamino)methylideneamino]imidazole-4-carboxamide isomerase [Oscillospiraceae bacterium]